MCFTSATEPQKDVTWQQLIRRVCKQSHLAFMIKWASRDAHFVKNDAIQKLHQFINSKIIISDSKLTSRILYCLTT